MSFLRRINSSGNTEIPLDREELIFGRDDSCDIMIDKYEGISRQHCGFHRYEDGVVTVTDFSSRNGTWVNDKQIFTETKLKHHDQVRISSEVQFEYVNPDSPEAKNEERVKAKQAEREKRAIKVEGNPELSDAMTEVSEELGNRGFKSIMAEIVRDAKKKPTSTTRRPGHEQKDDDLP
jgi:pSer/pThr/pTyr-binding forkhead associated (FHA) protein